jgi:hypothetical protein
MVTDPCAGLHDEGKWGKLENFLVPGGMTALMYRQDSRKVVSDPGKGGRYIARFETRGAKFKAVEGYWEVTTEFAQLWCKEIAIKARDNSNVPYEVNNIEDVESALATALATVGMSAAQILETPPTYPLRNKPGLTRGRKAFQEYDGKDAFDAFDFGWTSLEIDVKTGFVLNFSKVFWNKNHPTNRWLFKVGTQSAATRTPVLPAPLKGWQIAENTKHPVGSGDGDDRILREWEPAKTAFGSVEKDARFATLNEGHTLDNTIHGPTAAFVAKTCDPEQLAAVRDHGPYAWLDFTTGSLEPSNAEYGDCILEAMVGMCACVLPQLCCECDMPDLSDETTDMPA